MKSIIYDIDVLSVPSEPLTFLTEQGAKTEEGEEIIKKDGLMQTVTITVPQEDNKQIIENELMKHIYPLIQQVGMKF